MRPLNDFLDELDTFREQIPLDVLVEGLADLHVDLSTLNEYLRFNPERYQRNLLRAGDVYHALLLCWRAGQRSPIHDHRGSHCGVRVLSGCATESTFLTTETGLVYPTASRDLSVGAVCASNDADIHQVSNLHVADDLVTLHIYSPPLLVMGQYSLTSSQVSDFSDPVFEYSLGGGI
ncbi:MAG: hypothetical protein Tsb009_10290 [Planctomycetaceae bacterium]